MVVFTCDGCGDTLKKAKVDAHASKCRSCESVSCVDCNVSFYGDDYRQHVSCVSEAERYEKSIYRGPKKTDNGHVKKAKLSPQQAWMNLIQCSVDNAPSNLKRHLQQIAELGDNCPRKEKQFRNFVANSLKLRNETISGEIWEYLLKCRESEQQSKTQIDGEKTTQTSKERNQDQSAEEVSSSCKGKVGKMEEDENAPLNEKKDANEMAATETFDSSPNDLAMNSLVNCDASNLDASAVIKTMKKVLKKSPGQKMKLKALRKEVHSKLALDKQIKEKLKALMKKQLEANAIDKVKLDGKTVILVS